MIVMPRYLCLDSSHWISLCASLSEKSSRAAALRRLREIASAGWILGLSFHQLMEILAFGNERRAIAELSALRYVGALAVVDGSDDSCLPGTVVDVQRRELEQVAAHPAAMAEEVRDRVRATCLRMTTGGAVLDAAMPDIHLFCDALAARREREREIASLSQNSALNFSGERFQLDGKVRDEKAIDVYFAALGERLAEELMKSGDVNLSDPNRTAKDFVEGLAQLKRNILDSPRPIVELLKVAGLTLDDVSDIKTVGELGELAHFKKAIEASAKGTQLSGAQLRSVRQTQLPTWLVHRAVLRHRQLKPRAEASNLGDTHLLSLAPYFDAITVDRHMSENVLRIRRKDPEASRWLTTVLKASNWSRALDQLITEST